MDDFKEDDTKNKAVREATQTALGKTTTNQKLTKKQSMLKAFIEAGDKGLNCFEAVKLHDYVLRTTVCDLQKAYGIKILRKWEKVPNGFETTTDCKRYWLDDATIRLAKSLLKRANESGA